MDKTPLNGKLTQGPGCEDYTVAILGDTHYDAEPESEYHSHYDESNQWAKIQHEEFRRNGEMWRLRCPKLLRASAALATAKPTRFILQLGDVIQGDCDDPPTHRRMFERAVAMLREPYPALMPFLTVIGNHDFRGKGAREVYLDVAGRFMEAQIGREARYPVFSFDVAGDRWVFCDFEMHDLQPLIDALESAGGSRHVFLVTHGPFTAPDAGSFRWRLGGRPVCDALRPALYDVLCRRHAVVLSGHTHYTAFYRHEGASGSFCEFTCHSVWMDDGLASIEPFLDSPADYGTFAAERHRGGSHELDFKEQLDWFRPGLREYFFSKAAGHARMDVGASGVKIDFYPGASETPARTFTFR